MLPVAEKALTRGRDAWNKTHGLSCMSMDHHPLELGLLSCHFTVIQKIFPYIPNVIFITVTTYGMMGDIASTDQHPQKSHRHKQTREHKNDAGDDGSSVQINIPQKKRRSAFVSRLLGRPTTAFPNSCDPELLSFRFAS